MVIWDFVGNVLILENLFVFSEVNFIIEYVVNNNIMFFINIVNMDSLDYEYVIYYLLFKY